MYATSASAAACATHKATLTFDNSLLIKSARASALGAIGSGGGGGAVGCNGRVALLAFGWPLDARATRYGLRIGVSVHRVGGSGDGVLRKVEIGVVQRLRYAIAIIARFAAVVRACDEGEACRQDTRDLKQRTDFATLPPRSTCPLGV